MTLSGKKVLIGITGGIAAYKICELIRDFIKLNANVKVIITKSAKEFVTETTLSTLSKNPVYCEQFNIENWNPEHISLADEADLFIVAPASANTIGKIANGICDNLLTSVLSACKAPMIIAPAMNCNMWENKFVQENIEKLKSNNFTIIPPESGELACGYNGTGRLASIDKIKNKSIKILTEKPFLKGKKIVITAGGTIEEIDPVRYIGNYSSGKMGIALADAAYQFGAEVELISTVEANKPYSVKKVKSANEMLESVQSSFINSEILIMAAAVADYKPVLKAEQKIKKENTEKLTLELTKNPDILKETAKTKQENQLIIGFCAESENLINNAQTKLQSKSLDYIIANDISNKEIGFNSDYNSVSIIDKNNKITTIEKTLKTELAKQILKELFNAKS